MSAAKACEHLVSTPSLETLLVLDAHLHPTDAYLRCARCDAHYLVEMADTNGELSVFRVSAVPADAVARTVRSVNKGSCDINRARDEVASLAASTRELDTLLVMRRGAFSGTVTRPRGMSLPKRSWRELPCDGSVIEALDLD